jgi:HEAT repeat protein
MERNAEVERLLDLSRDGSAGERCAAIADLEEMGAREAVPAILALVGFPDVGVRANVACALGVLGDEGVGAALLTLLGDADSLVRCNAAEALGLLRYAGGVDALIRALRADEDSLVRLDAAEALGRFDDDRALAALVAALDDPAEEVRAYAADSIGRSTRAEFLPILSQKIESEPSLYTKAFLLSALYRLGDMSWLVALVDMLSLAGDDFRITIANLIANSVAPGDVARVAGALEEVARKQPALRFEVESLKTSILADAVLPFEIQSR